MPAPVVQPNPPQQPKQESPFGAFVGKMGKVLEDKKKEGLDSGLEALLKGAEEQLHKIREAVKRNEPALVQKHSVHLANYGFLIHSKD